MHLLAASRVQGLGFGVEGLGFFEASLHPNGLLSLQRVRCPFRVIPGQSARRVSRHLQAIACSPTICCLLPVRACTADLRADCPWCGSIAKPRYRGTPAGPFMESDPCHGVFECPCMLADSKPPSTQMLHVPSWHRACSAERVARATAASRVSRVPWLPNPTLFLSPSPNGAAPALLSYCCTPFECNAPKYLALRAGVDYTPNAPIPKYTMHTQPEPACEAHEPGR